MQFAEATRQHHEVVQTVTVARIPLFSITWGNQQLHKATVLLLWSALRRAIAEAEPCADHNDHNDQCGYWAAIGECQANPKYMLVMCQKSCHSCPGDSGALHERMYQHLEKKISSVRDAQQPQILEASYSPRALVVDRFLSEEECEALKDLARPHLHHAETINRSTGAAYLDKVRTNSQFYLDRAEHYKDPLVLDIVQRMHRIARVPMGHAEPLQVGRYQKGQFYQTHFDSEPLQGVRRAVTVLVYLDPPEAGGETIFPKHQRCQVDGFEVCCNRLEELVTGEGKGFWVRGQKGQAVIFYSHNLDGQHNSLSMHGSCPVREGEKWVAQQWFRIEPYAGSPYFQFLAPKSPGAV
eukprot:s2245_g6.t3